MARIAWGVGLLAALVALVHGVLMVLYPLQLDYAEGVVLQLTDLLRRGEPIYRDPQQFPWLVSPYAPLFPATAALLGGGFAAGRALALLCAVGCAVLVGCAAGRRAGWGAGLTAATVFVASPLFLNWAPLDRVDLLGLLFDLGGLYWVERTLLRESPSAVGERGSIAVAAVLFALAFWSKQTFVLGLVAASLAVGLKCRRAGLGLLAAGVIAMAVPFVFLNRDGRLADIFFRFNAMPWSADTTRLWTVEWLRTMVVALPISAVFLARAWRECPAWAIYFVLALLSVPGVGRVGAWYNYFLPLQAATAVVCGLAWSAAAPWRPMRDVLLLAQVALGVLLWLPPTMPSVADVARGEVPALWTGGATRWLSEGKRDAAAYEALLKTHPGPVLAENLGNLVVAGRPAALCDPITLFTLSEMGLWDESELMRAIEERRFAAVFIQEPSPRNLRFPSRAIVLILKHYQPAARIGPDWVLLPRPG